MIKRVWAIVTTLLMTIALLQGVAYAAEGDLADVWQAVNDASTAAVSKGFNASAFKDLLQIANL